MLKLLPFLIVIQLISFRLYSQDEPLKSPYFVDDIHCSGLRTEQLEESWLYPKDIIPSLQKDVNKTACYQVLSIFGIKKMEWLDPEDFEKLEMLIQKSGLFESAEISLKKSELKNHIHLFLKVIPKSKHFYSWLGDFKYFNSKNSDYSKRMESTFNFKYLYRENALSEWSVGIDILNSVANGNISSSTHIPLNSSPSNDPSLFANIMGDDGKGFLDLEDWHSINLYGTMSNRVWENYIFKGRMDLYLFTLNHYDDDLSRTSLVLDLLYSSVVSEYFSSQIGPSIVLGTKETETSDESNSPHFGIKYNAIVRKDYSNFFKVDASFYVDSSGHFAGLTSKIKTQREFAILNNIFLGLGAEIYEFDKMVLLEYNAIPGANIGDNYYISMGKNLYFGENIHQIKINYGSTSISNEDPDDSSLIHEKTKDGNYMYTTHVETETNYLTLKYQGVFKGWNLGLGASYYFDRLY